MRVDMNYGKGMLPVDLPDDWNVTVIRKPDMPVIADPVSALEVAFDAPVGVPPLDVLARDARSACILICDITRPVPNRLILGP
ncbi:MAG: lactate racemase domain-containing protein, partial [Alphaproteobacteria bacterium]|nr:lactate racemase domain-containing protein [Alphaproteobacteria bacterium]